uniref:DUF632 domain-containing protein n=1 Tax=Aegilops tauschii subsp. strangulata TaxID=200361 RepID=A0A453AMR6_AEGTS
MILEEDKIQFRPLLPEEIAQGSKVSNFLATLFAAGRKFLFLNASSSICRKYDEKCKQLRDQESRGKKQIITDFTRAAVKDLHSRIQVAIQKIDLISMNTENLRDKELQPQLDELIESFTMMWTTMHQCHRFQHSIIKSLSSSCKLETPLDSEP